MGFQLCVGGAKAHAPNNLAFDMFGAPNAWNVVNSLICLV